MLLFLSLSLSFQDPVINDIFPTFGPKSGNTMLTIRGAFLDTGNRREVTIGKAACKIQRWVGLIYPPWLSPQAFVNPPGWGTKIWKTFFFAEELL